MKKIKQNTIFFFASITLFFVATTCDYDWDKDCKNMPKQGVETGESRVIFDRDVTKDVCVMCVISSD